MKRLFLSIILCACTLPMFAQNPKVLDLSNGGCCIRGIQVEEIDNDFIVIPELDSVPINQIVIKTGILKRLNVCKAPSNDTVFTKVMADFYPDIIGKRLIFTLQVGNNYVVKHNGKQWNIKVRKDGSLDTFTNVTNGRAIFINAQNMLCIGDSVVSMAGRDTLRYVLTDSLVVSEIDRRLALKCDGKEIEDKLVTDIDDKFFYSTKSIVSADSVFHAGDRLTIEKNGKFLGVIVFEAKDDTKNLTKQIIFIVIVVVFVTVVIFVCQWFIGNRKKHSDKNDIKDGKADDKDDGGKDVDVTTSPQMPVSESYNRLNDMIETLLKIMPKIEVYAKDIEDAKAETRRQVEIEMQTKVESVQRQAEEAEKKRKAAEDSQKAAIEAAKKEKELQEKEMNRLKEDKRKADERAETAEKSKKKAVEDAVKNEKEAHDKEEKRLNVVVERQKEELTRTKNSLESTQKELKDTKDDRDKKKFKIEQLEKAQEKFTLSLTSVPFATAYSKLVLDLLDLGRQIRTSAYAVLDIDVDDPYFIMKAVSRFGKMMDEIDVDKFLVDVNMVAKAKFIFKDSSLATFNGENKDIDNIVRSYFFNQYLEKYVSALMVLNESMTGLKLLLPELKSQVDKFEKFRTELLALAKKLNITVLYVKVGDMAGENVDLKAKPVDVEIGKPGQILDVENCIVYLTDSRKPQTKIKVTIKK